MPIDLMQIIIRCVSLPLVDTVPSKDLFSSTLAQTIHPAGASRIKEPATKYPRRIEIVKYFAGDKEGNDAIAKEIKGKYGRVDTIIANDGESPTWLPSVMMSDFDHLRYVLRHCELHGKETFVDKLRSSLGAKIYRE
jgi:hypothetical protein